VLIVGGRTTNFPASFREHPRIVIWESTENPERYEIPENTRVIIPLRFIGHAVFKRLQDYVRQKQALLWPGLANTGELKALLSLALDITPDEDTKEVLATDVSSPVTTAIATAADDAQPDTDEPEPTMPTPPKEKGAVLAFVKQHADPKASTTTEARRLMVLAKRQGLQTTESSLMNAIYRARQQTIVTAHPVTSRTPATTGTLSHVAEALKIIDDVAAGLSLLKEAVLRVQADEETTRTTTQELRAYLSKLGV